MRALVTLQLTPVAEAALRQQLDASALRVAGVPGVDDLAWADVVLGNLPAEVLDRQSNIRWLHSPNVGMDAYRGVRRSSLTFTHSTNVMNDAVAEHGLALILSLSRQLGLLYDAQRRHVWARDEYTQAGSGWLLSGKAAHVLGYGTVARGLIGRLHLLGMDVTVYRRVAGGDDPCVARFLSLDDLVESVADADVLVNLLPLTPETTGIVGPGVLAALRATSVVVNLGRGPVIDEVALIAALLRGNLRGAALDVFAAEPLSAKSPLWDLPNVILSPHVAGRFDDEALEHVTQFLALLESYERSTR